MLLKNYYYVIVELFLAFFSLPARELQGITTYLNHNYIYNGPRKYSAFLKTDSHVEDDTILSNYASLRPRSCYFRKHG